MKIVVDASVALKWVVEEPGSEAAVSLCDDELIAPVLWLAEAANALWRRVRISDITAAEARTRLSELLNAPVALTSMEPRSDQALRLAAEIGHPVYDCLYLALALQQQTHVVIADLRFAAVVAQPGLSGRVRLLSG